MASKVASFWQWPKMMIEKLPVMGYSLATDDGGASFRYTEWVYYNYTGSGRGGGQGCETCMDWSRGYGTELYNLTADPAESRNIHGSAVAAKGLEARLSSMLHAGWRRL